MTGIRKIYENLLPSLGKKVAFAVGIVFLLGGGTFVYFAYSTGYSMLEKGALTKAHGVAEFGKSILEYVMLKGQNDQLQEALERAVTSHQADNVLILDKNGKIILNSSGEKTPEMLPLDKYSELPDYPGEKFLLVKEHDALYEYIITPIIKRSDCYACHREADTTQGYLAVKISMDDILSASVKHRTTNILMTIVTFTGLGGVIFLVLLFVVVKPVTKLRNQINAIEHQIEQYERGEQVRFSELEVPGKRDEIAGLMNAFNTLVIRLNAAHEKLHEMHHVQLEHADRLATAGEIAASIAHEIKNPITGVLGALQIFDSEISVTDDRKEIIAEMIIQLERVNHAINDLLSYARPAPPLFGVIDIRDILQKTLILLSKQMKEAHISVEVEGADKEIKLYADKKQLQQVLWNILLNGIQAAEINGRLRVAIEENTDEVKIIVTDSGQGIKPEQLESVFRPFYTTKHKGTGLGMTISKRIIEQHQGTITITSEPGKGTVVTASIPKEQHYR